MKKLSQKTQAKYNPGPKPLSEPENQFLVKLLDKYKPGLIISFHTWKPILNFNGDCQDIAEYLNLFNKYEMAGDIGYPTPGSLGSFGVEKYKSPVLTFECPELKTHRESPKDIWKENRTMVKTYVYGLGYGRTEYGIAAGFDISVDLALEYMQRFFSVIPEIVEWQERIKFQVKNGDDLVTPFGRHRRYNLITKANERNVMNEALAFLPQSTASDCTIRAAIFSNPILEHEFNAKIVNLVHDAIMIDSPQDVVEDALKIVEECMIDSAQAVVGDFVKFATQSSYGNSWEDLV